jgi:hypothetical protein
MMKEGWTNEMAGREIRERKRRAEKDDGRRTEEGT